MTEQLYDFQKRLLQVHRPNRRTEKPLAAGQIEITADWCITAPGDGGLLDRTAADLQDYFAISMGVNLQITPKTVSDFAIFYEIDPNLGKEGAYRVEVGKNTIRLIGTDPRAAAQASYLLEDLCNLEEAPYLIPTTHDRSPIFRCRMVHSGYAEDNFPDEHLQAIVHCGINAILVFACDVDRSPTHSFSFNDLIARANAVGLDVYAYSYLQSRIHPEDEGAEAFYDGLYGNLFRKCPGFKGVILVGESVEFPSKDPHTTGRLRLDNIGPDGQKIIKDKPSPGWYPCYDYPQWLDVVKRAIRREKPDADIVFWTYNWGYHPEAERLALIDNLPTDISLEVTFEMFEDELRQGVPSRSVDYTISFPDPGKYFVSEAHAAKRRGIPLYAMTNAAGTTWDVGVVPYIPAPGLWLRRFEKMRTYHEICDLCGSMDGHHYGCTPSMITDLAKAYFAESAPNGQQILERILVRDWGRKNLQTAKEAFALFDAGVYDLVSENKDQYGPLRIGPAYPLVLFEDEKIQLPCVPGSHNGGNAICFPHYKYRNALQDPAERTQLDGGIRALGVCARRMLQGAALLRDLLPTLPTAKRDEAERIAGIGEFIGRTFLTTHHVKRWYKEKMAIAYNEGDRTAHLAELKAIGAAEIENAKATLPLVDFDSRLGFEPSMDYMGQRPSIEWKIAVMERILTEEIPKLEQ